jgi:DNA-binding NarL/FixJ family response regulator
MSTGSQAAHPVSPTVEHPAAETAGEPTARTATVLVYASHPAVRAGVISALGTRPSPGLELTFVELSDGEQVVERLDEGGIDLAILDGEAAPRGGMGICRQLKAELDDPPPVLLLVGRRDDAWLATWSRAEAVVGHPVDAVTIARSVTELLAGLPVAATT